MGLPKRDHIAALMAEPEIAARWQAAHGKIPNEAEIDALYDTFVPLNAGVVTDFAELIPGVERTAGRSVRYTHDDYPTVFRTFLAAMRLGAAANADP